MKRKDLELADVEIENLIILTGMLKDKESKSEKHIIDVLDDLSSTVDNIRYYLGLPMKG